MAAAAPQQNAHFVDPQPEPVGPKVMELIAFAYELRLPVLLEGNTGVGKSQLTAQAARALGIDYVILDLPLLEPPDLVGIPYREDQLSVDAPPKKLPRGGRGILMLEELNRADRPVQQAALQLLTARCLHQYRLPEGWSVVAAINPEDGSYFVNRLDRALRARFLQLRVEADAPSWIGWAREHGIHPSIVKLAEQHDRMLLEVPPRSWEYASHVLSSNRRDEASLMRAALGGYLPGPWLELLLQEAEIDDDLDEALDPRVLLRVYHLSPRLRARVEGLARSGRTDRLDGLYRSLHAIVSSPELGRAADDGGIELASLEGVMQDLPGDLREGLQEAFAANPNAVHALPVDADDVLVGYRRRSIVRRRVQSWLGDRLPHRGLALAGAVARRLREHPDPETLREDRRARTGLGHFVSDLIELRPTQLISAIEDLGIECRLDQPTRSA